MTGKELLLVLGGAAVLGGATGLATTMFAKTSQLPSEQEDEADEIKTRLSRIEAAIEKTTTAMNEGRAAVADLKERVVAAELKLANPPPAPTGPAMAPGAE